MSQPERNQFLVDVASLPTAEEALAEYDKRQALDIMSGARDFREEDHPRDDHGKFAAADGGAVATAELPPAVRQPGEAAMRNVGTWLEKRGWIASDFEANTRAIFDAATPEQREVGMRWYEQAHSEAQALADAHGLTIEQGAGVIAAMSPNREWEGNLADAKAVANLVTAPEFTLSSNVLSERYNAAMMYATKLAPGEARTKAEDKAQALHDLLSPWVGTHDTKEVPTEVLARFAHTQQYPDNVEKAIEILRGTNPRDVLWSFEQMGPRGAPKVTVPSDSGLKVRSFYANILSPTTSREITVDTHIMRVVTGDMTIRPDDSGLISGNSARYTAFRDPIYKIADEEGLLPHQVQAIVWTQINDATSRRDVGAWAVKDYTLDDGTSVPDADFIIDMIFAGWSEGEARALLLEEQGEKALSGLFDRALWKELRRVIMPSVQRMFHNAFMEGSHLASIHGGRKDNPYRTGDVVDAMAIMRGERAGPRDLPRDITRIGRAAQDVIANYSDDWWESFEESTQDRMRRAIARAEAEGLTTDDVMEELEPLFGEDRAQLIASTETARLMGMGAVATYDAAGIEAWQWRTVEDTLVDPICEEMGRRAEEDGEAFDSEDPFNVAHPNCRCWPVPADEDAIVTGTLEDALDEVANSV